MDNPSDQNHCRLAYELESIRIATKTKHTMCPYSEMMTLIVKAGILNGFGISEANNPYKSFLEF